jgi:hypothetical protein
MPGATGEISVEGVGVLSGRGSASLSSASPVVLKVAAGPGTPGVYALHQSYPDPFNPSTTLSYDLAEAGRVSLVVYDLLGRTVRVLVDEVQDAGTKSLRFDASGLPSGVYLYRLQAGSFSDVRKMVLMK